jgi:hypothetical protein
MLLPIAILIAILSLFGTIYLSRTQEVLIGYSLSAPGGGVFVDEASCDVREKFSSAASSIRLTGRDGSEIQIVLAPGDWQRTGDTCSASIRAQLKPEEEYGVYVGDESLGSIVVNDATAVYYFENEIDLTTEISGTIILSQQYSWQTTWPSGLISSGYLGRSQHFESHYNNSDLPFGACEGFDIYSFVTPKWLSIFAMDSAGNVLGSSKILAGTYDRTTSGLVSKCVFKWKVSVPQSDSGYILTFDIDNPKKDDDDAIVLGPDSAPSDRRDLTWNLGDGYITAVKSVSVSVCMRYEDYYEVRPKKCEVPR